MSQINSPKNLKIGQHISEDIVHSVYKNQAGICNRSQEQVTWTSTSLQQQILCRELA